MEKKYYTPALPLTILCLMIFNVVLNAQTAVVSGNLKVWYPVTITFEGPNVSETESTFTDYRLDVTFTKGSKSYIAPGYFAADGDAANTSAASGNKWRVKFVPDEAGTWNYSVSFLKGNQIAKEVNPAGGENGILPDGKTGSFEISPADTTAPGFYAKGMLRYVGEHFLQFQGSKEWFVKAGPGSPEDFFGYQDFDDTYDGPGGLTINGGKADRYLYEDHGFDAGKGRGLHRYLFHEEDWQPGDPQWQDGKGKGIIGAINYLSSIGANTLYHILLTINDDSDNTWPWINRNTKLIYDVSKLDQWAIVYEHMDRKGINADLYLCESDNSLYLNNGNMGLERSIYYRELIARFGFKLGLRYNLGEEHHLNPEKMKSNSDYLSRLDPYGHPVGSHSSHKKEKFVEKFDAMMGYKNFHGAWFQLHDNYDISYEIKSLLDKSKAAGHKWVVSDDETYGIKENNVSQAERNIWKVLMAGGEGMNLYIAYNDYTYADVSLENFRRMNKTLNYLVNAKDLFLHPEVNEHLPDLISKNILVGNIGTRDWPHCLASDGNAYIIYKGASDDVPTLNLTGRSGEFIVKWWDPRNGGELRNGSVTSVTGGGKVNLGTPPSGNLNQSWAITIIAANKVPVWRVSISNCPFTELDVRKTHQLHAYLNLDDTANRSITWSSSDTSVVIVDSNGLITTNSEGSATIKATAQGGFSDSCIINVVEKVISVYGITIGNCPNTILQTGDTHQLSANVAPIDANNKSVTWSSSSPEVASVDESGLITAVSQGTSKITVTTNDGGYTNTCNIGVMALSTSADTYSLTNKLKVYPNPASTKLVFEFPDFGAEKKINIYNAIGQLLMTKNTNEQKLTIDIRHLNAEVLLLVKINSEQYTDSFKIILSKI